jgi:hypothetical protein
MPVLTGPKEIEVGAVDDQDVLRASHGGAVTEFTALPIVPDRPGSKHDNGESLPKIDAIVYKLDEVAEGYCGIYG